MHPLQLLAEFEPFVRVAGAGQSDELGFSIARTCGSIDSLLRPL